MKIGILSFTTTRNNYGQLLQCYALQHYLRLQGHTVRHIRYVPPSAKSTVHSLKDLIKLSQRYLTFDFVYDKVRSKLHPQPSDEKRKFNQFLGLYIQVFPEVYTSPSQLISDSLDVEALIVGSDQVWGRPLGTEDSKIWFLKFGGDGVRRISYAASIGRNLADFELPLLKKELQGFKRISVRENKARLMCSRCGVDAQLTLDPTLLLSEEDYPLASDDACEDISLVPDKPYIFAYILNVLKEKDLGWGQLGKYAADNGLEVIPVYSSGYYSAYPIISGYDPSFPTIPQWLDLIKHAEVVVTTSFHGMVFSILMHRPFLVIPLKGKHSGGNDRIMTLLTSLGLEERIYDPTAPVEAQINAHINWHDVNWKLAELRKSSEQFLSDSLA